MKNKIAKLAIISLLVLFQSHVTLAQDSNTSTQKKSTATVTNDQNRPPRPGGPGEHGDRPAPPEHGMTPPNGQMPPKPGSAPRDIPTADKKQSQAIIAQNASKNTPDAQESATSAPADTTNEDAFADSMDIASVEEADSTIVPVESEGFHKMLKTKYIEGDAGFMSFVALALVLGLAFCIERIIYLTLSEINAKKLMADIEDLVLKGDIEGAKTICRDTRGPVASICYQGLSRIDESIDDIERSITSYGSVQAANLEKGCSWITLFIAMAPSLGFLGTVIGMVMAFEQIQMAGDISPTIVAAGMKVALITTIFGLIAALILQVFYNYILSKIEHLTSQMEESAISMLDIIMKYKLRG